MNNQPVYWKMRNGKSIDVMSMDLNHLRNAFKYLIKNLKTMAHIDSSCVKAIEFAKTLNPDIRIDNGINWIWAYGFKSREDAKKFDDYCNNNNCETRGVYSGSLKGTYDVRFR